MLSFTYNSIASTHADFGIVGMKVSRPLLPSIDNNLLSIWGRDGAYDLGRNLMPRYINVFLTLEGTSLTDKRAKVRKIASWLNQDEVKALIFSDEPTIQHMARVYGEIRLQEQANLADCTITFVVPNAHAESTTETTVSAVSGTNTGTLATPCLITLSASAGSSIKVDYGTDFVEITDTFTAGQAVIINTDTQLVTKAGTSVMDKVDIDSTFFKLAPGAFTLTLTGATITNVKFRERFI